MKPQAYEALQKAKALFRHPAEVRHEDSDDIPEQITQAPEPIRKPKVVLLPPNAPKFDQHSMKEEHKHMNQPKQTDKYVDMSTAQACAECIKMGIAKPAEIAKLTGKPVKQIYTAMWHLRKGDTKKYKSLKKKIPAPYARTEQPQVPQQVKARELPARDRFDDFDPRREPTAWEDAHHVVFKSRAEYDAEIERLNQRISDLLIEKQEQLTIIKYLERKNNV